MLVGLCCVVWFGSACRCDACVVLFVCFCWVAFVACVCFVALFGARFVCALCKSMLLVVGSLLFDVVCSLYLLFVVVCAGFVLFAFVVAFVVIVVALLVLFFVCLLCVVLVCSRLADIQYHSFALLVYIVALLLGAAPCPTD